MVFCEMSVLDGQAGIGLMLLSMCFFKFLHELLGLLTVPQFVLLKARQNAYYLFRWRNLVVSFSHALCTGIGTIVCFASEWNEMISSMETHVSWFTFGVCSFATGYFLYDTLDILMARRVCEKWEIVVHHSAILFCTLYLIVNVRCIGYQTLAMTIEVNTTFLHGRKLLQLAGYEPNSSLLNLMRVINLLTFIPFRFGPLLLIISASFFKQMNLPFWYLFQLRIALTVLLFVNVVLFHRLIRADTAEASSRKRLSVGHQRIDSSAAFCRSLDVNQPYQNGT